MREKLQREREDVSMYCYGEQGNKWWEKKLQKFGFLTPWNMKMKWRAQEKKWVMAPCTYITPSFFPWSSCVKKRCLILTPIPMLPILLFLFLYFAPSSVPSSLRSSFFFFRWWSFLGCNFDREKEKLMSIDIIRKRARESINGYNSFVGRYLLIEGWKEK